MIDCLVVYVCLILMVMLGVAYFTLLERKVLGYVQLRKGPNKVGVWGLLQPFSDALKLFTSEFNFPVYSNWLLFVMSPLVGFLFSLVLWMVFPIGVGWFDFLYGLLFFFCVSSFGVYFVVGSGWFSNSKYALLGGYRAVAQMISYEVGMILVILPVVFYESCYLLWVEVGYSWFYGLGFIFSFLMWMVCCLAETNRSPYDFAEAESELVSGFNVEYSGGGFALIFLSEYSSIMLISMVSCIYFFSGVYLFYCVLIVFFLWVRGSLPRVRYDKLMMMVWSVFLPCSLNLLLYVVGNI
uniref:NADH-ubiquinone oxidoreductase chain 1 n=1 Tax=Pseudocellus pearsei TaxID=58148 RepID=A9LI84_9ARAC|nr:NADH dehydrogenase subunit 1 [Pseudocellus pearsei]ABS71915.1 NADH dehydrogenase subunit 1 [Pseudocellus pearsei]